MTGNWNDKVAVQPAFPNAPNDSLSNTNERADQMIGLGSAAASTAAPTINNATAGADRTATLGGLSALGTTAAGGGVAQQAAQAQFGVGQNANMLASLQGLGNYRGGGAGAAAAANGAIGSSAAGGIRNATAAADTRAQMSGQAADAYNRGLGGLANTDWSAAAGAADLQGKQNAINQQGQLGYLNLANAGQTDQLNASTAQYDANVGASSFGEGLAAKQDAALIGGGVGLGMGAVGAAGNAFGGSNSGGGGSSSSTTTQQASDVRMREPGGGAGWTIREEPDFLLARNDLTGELRKLATQPLTKEEHAQAKAPHGAGPIGSVRPDTLQVGDLGVGGGSQAPGASPSGSPSAPPAPSFSYGGEYNASQSDGLNNRVGYNNNQLAAYGSSQEGAKAFNGYTDALAAGAMTNKAPQIGSANVDADATLQGNGLAALGQTANGQGPAIAAARQQLAQNTAQGQQSNTAIANSASGGGRGLAAAAGTSSLQNAEAAGGLSGQQNALTSQMQSQAQQQYAQTAAGIQKANAEGSLQQAGLTQDQGALNQAGALGFYGAGQNATGAELSARANQYAASQAANNAKKAADQQKWNALGAAGFGVAESVL